MNYTFENRKDKYTELWAKMDIRPNRLALVERQADKIIGFKPRYEAIEAATGVPYYIIGLMHLRESNFNFNTHLHNGDPLTKRTYHVPAGRPVAPPKNGRAYTFEESAIDALVQKGYDKIKDWSIERIAYILEKYNGFGYIQYGVNSPYLWASTDNYTKGKYIRDGVYSASTVDTQLGTMAVLKVIFDKTGDGSKKTQTEIAVQAPKAEPNRPATKELNKVSRKSWWAEVLKWLGLVPATGAMGAKTLDASNIEATKTYLDTAKGFVSDYGVWLFIVGCFAAFLIGILIQKYIKDDIVEGRSVPSGKDEDEAPPEGLDEK